MTENGTITKEQAQEITPEMAQQVIDNHLRQAGQSFFDGFNTLQAEHNGARFVTVINTQDGPIILEVSHAVLNNRLVQISRG